MITYKKFYQQLLLEKVVDKISLKDKPKNIEKKLLKFVKKHPDLYFDIDGTLLYDEPEHRITPLGEIVIKNNLSIKILTMGGITESYLKNLGFKIKEFHRFSGKDGGPLFGFVDDKPSKKVQALIDDEIHPLTKNQLLVIN